MPAKTQSTTKSTTKSKVNPVYIGLGFLAVGVIAVVLFLVLGGSGGNICTTGVSNQAFIYPESESYSVSLEKVIECAGKVGVPVDPSGLFSNNVTTGELAKVMGEVCKQEGKGVYGIAFSTIRYSVLSFGKGSGKPVELYEFGEGDFTLDLPKDPLNGDFELETARMAAAATYTSEPCPSKPVSLAGGKAPPPVQLPVAGTQAPTASPAP